jgi:hypothetical protein
MKKVNDSQLKKMVPVEMARVLGIKPDRETWIAKSLKVSRDDVQRLTTVGRYASQAIHQ